MNRSEMKARFQEIFKISYEEGVDRLKLLLRRSVDFTVISSVIDNVESSKVSMNERDFGIFAFFSCLGAGFIEELGVDMLSEKQEEFIEAEFEEISPEEI